MNHYPVSAEYSGNGEWESPGLAYEDYSRCHTESHVGRHQDWVPEFALNPEQLQIVLLARAWKYAHGGWPKYPADKPDRKELNRLATERALRGHSIRPDAAPIQFEARDMHIAAVRKAGGYLELQGAIAFRAWRLHEDSATIADALGLTGVCVRANLNRLRNIARGFGFPVGKAGVGFGTKRGPKRKPSPVPEPTLPFSPAGLSPYQSYVSFCRTVGVPATDEKFWQLISDRHHEYIHGWHAAALRAGWRDECREARRAQARAAIA